MLLYAAVVFLLAFLFQVTTAQFSGDGFKTPEEALPKDADYVWIEGPKTKKEHRYFFLSDGRYFGTGVVKKNLKGWTSGKGAYAKLPDPLKENEITSAYSDQKILFGLIKRNGYVIVTVNGEKASFIELSKQLPKETLDDYQVNGYSLWYVDLKKLENHEHFHIEVFNEEGQTISELSI